MEKIKLTHLAEWVNFMPKREKTQRNLTSFIFRLSPMSTLKTKSIENYNPVALKQAHLLKKTVKPNTSSLPRQSSACMNKMSEVV